MRRLADLAREGARGAARGAAADVRGGTPSSADAPSSARRCGRRLEPGTGPAPRIALGKGSVLVGDDVLLLLAQAGVAREPMVDAGLRFVRRLDARGADYFLVNRGAAPVDGWVTLGTTTRSAVLLDPRSPTASARRRCSAAGDRGVPAACARRVGGPARVGVRAGPGPLAVHRGLRCRGSGGRPLAPRVRRGRPVALPAPSEAAALASWTTLADAEAQRFAGTARYTVRFERPSGPAEDWLLDLGRVAETAR